MLAPPCLPIWLEGYFPNNRILHCGIIIEIYWHLNLFFRKNIAQKNCNAFCRLSDRNIFFFFLKKRAHVSALIDCFLKRWRTSWISGMEGDTFPPHGLEPDLHQWLGAVWPSPRQDARAQRRSSTPLGPHRCSGKNGNAIADFYTKISRMSIIDVFFKKHLTPFLPAICHPSFPPSSRDLSIIVHLCIRIFFASFFPNGHFFPPSALGALLCCWFWRIFFLPGAFLFHRLALAIISPP